jgi:TruD family tRNA pseudouridine synthase
MILSTNLLFHYIFTIVNKIFINRVLSLEYYFIFARWMSFLFKQVSSDFRVFEELPFSLSGNGDAFYVYIEKRNLTTHELLEHIQKKCHISRMSIGIAGLKDKKAIARQWISIYARALKKA